MAARQNCARLQHSSWAFDALNKFKQCLRSNPIEFAAPQQREELQQELGILLHVALVQLKACSGRRIRVK